MQSSFDRIDYKFWNSLCGAVAQAIINAMLIGGICLVGLFLLRDPPRTHHGSASLGDYSSMRADWGYVRSIQNSSDRNTIWVSRHKRSLMKIDVVTGRQLEEVHLPTGYLPYLQLNQEGTCAFFLSPAGKLQAVRREHKVWESLQVRPAHNEDRHYALCPVADTLAIATETFLELWSLKNSATPLVKVPLSCLVAGMEWSPDGRHLLVFTSDAVLELLDGDTLTVVRRAQTSVWNCGKCIWAPGGQYVASYSAYSDDSKAAVWDLKGSETSLQHVECPSPPTVAALSHDGQWLAVPNGLDEFCVINVSDPGKSYELSSLSAPATAMQFSADGTSLVIGSQDGTLRCWSLADRQLTWSSSDTR